MIIPTRFIPNVLKIIVYQNISLWHLAKEILFSLTLECLDCYNVQPLGSKFHSVQHFSYKCYTGTDLKTTMENVMLF